MFVINCLTLITVGAWASESSHDGRRIKVVNNGVGVIAEAYSDSIVHFEVSTDPARQDVQRPIYTTPMVSDGNLKPANVTTRTNGLSTSKLDVAIDPESLCVNIFDKSRGRSIVRD